MSPWYFTHLIPLFGGKACTSKKIIALVASNILNSNNLYLSPGGWTYTDRALNLARERMFNEHYGSRKGAPKVNKIIFYFSLWVQGLTGPLKTTTVCQNLDQHGIQREAVSQKYTCLENTQITVSGSLYTWIFICNALKGVVFSN